MQRRFPVWLACLVSIGLAGAVCARPAPKSIDALRAMQFETRLTVARRLEDGPNFSAHLVAYESAGLAVHALVAVPFTDRPDRGYPVLVANHGHHPDPPQYGISADGRNARPGDYYRSIPALYAGHGFMVVMPDYRGHNDSEGAEFTDGMLESAYYTEDVVALLAGLGNVADADLDNVFMWGHSMGGEVTLRALLVTTRVRGASLWSSVGGDIWDQAYYYSRYEDPYAPDGSGITKHVIDELREDIARFEPAFDTDGVEPLLHLEHLRTPLIIHHAAGDRGAAYKWSQRLARELHVRSLPYEFYSYPGTAHFFDEATRAQAVARDVAFFRSLMCRSTAR